MIDNRVIEERHGWKLLLSHTPEVHFNDLPSDPDPQEIVRNKEVDVFMHGHTHHPKTEVLENGVVVHNPGHTKDEFDRGYAPSYSILDVSESEIVISIRSLLEGDVIKVNKIQR
jgi:predicted phosphodiesterase